MTDCRFLRIDIYHLNDYHGAFSLFHLPKVLPVCLSFHNAEFQALNKKHCSKYVRSGAHGAQAAGATPFLPPSPPSPSTIGPPPSFYDPSQAIVPQGPDYQQWIMENYPQGPAGPPQQQQQQQQYFAQGALPGNVSASFQQQQSQQLHVPPTHNQYNFVQEYNPEQGAYDSHLVPPPAPGPGPADRPQRGLPGRISGTSRRGMYPQVRVPSAGSFPPQPQQSPSHAYPLPTSATGDSYFYDEPAPPSATAPQPQQQQQHSSYNFVGYHPEQYPGAGASASYTPSSDLATLPSSVSTPSVGGTDDGQTHAYPPLVSQHPSTHSLHSQQQQQQQQQQAGMASASASASTSRQAAGRGRGRGGGKAKRQRVMMDDEGDGDSDTQSDDDGPFQSGGFTTVSVPPPQGQSALPSRL